MTEVRVERDSMGEVTLPKNAYYGAQTQRAVDNFPISNRRIAPELIHALGLVKLCAATANARLGRLSKGRAPLSEKEIAALEQADAATGGAHKTTLEKLRALTDATGDDGCIVGEGE